MITYKRFGPVDDIAEDDETTTEGDAISRAYERGQRAGKMKVYSPPAAGPLHDAYTRGHFNTWWPACFDDPVWVAAWKLRSEEAERAMPKPVAVIAPKPVAIPTPAIVAPKPVAIAPKPIASPIAKRQKKPRRRKSEEARKEVQKRGRETRLAAEPAADRKARLDAQRIYNAERRADRTPEKIASDFIRARKYQQTAKQKKANQ